MTRAYKNVIFRNKNRDSDGFGLRNPVIQEKIAEMCYLYRRTRPGMYITGTLPLVELIKDHICGIKARGPT